MAVTVDLTYSPHYLSHPHSAMSSRSRTTIPLSLIPTPLQQTIPHFPWIDLFPLAALHDNIICTSPRVNVHEFCVDMMGTMFATVDVSASSGLLVWGGSWLIKLWEMTEGFLQKWGWLLDDGCKLVRAIN